LSRNFLENSARRESRVFLYGYCVSGVKREKEKEKGMLLTKLNYSWGDFGGIHKKVGRTN
jgi:hypothetical protein